MCSGVVTRWRKVRWDRKRISSRWMNNPSPTPGTVPFAGLTQWRHRHVPRRHRPTDLDLGPPAFHEISFSCLPKVRSIWPQSRNGFGTSKRQRDWVVAVNLLHMSSVAHLISELTELDQIHSQCSCSLCFSSSKREGQSLRYIIILHEKIF